ncbi:MAG: S-methyl-5-thioribose-1-phosphate isomerase [bacterium]
MNVKTLYWDNEKLYILDQLKLPNKISYICCKNAGQVADAIRKMNLRGAPAIGVAAAYAFALAFRSKKFSSKNIFQNYVQRVANELNGTRPTAVNLFWACKRMSKKAKSIFKLNSLIDDQLLIEAKRIHEDDVAINKKIGENGEKLLKKGSHIITHCNAGALATGGYGTALGVIYSAFKKGKIKKVFVDETRPYLQGARLTMWELMQRKIPCQLITDNMAGFAMKRNKISACIIGADRVVSNGDVANKIGSYSLAVLADYHKIPFYVAAPLSTFDVSKKTGDEIVIEERSAKEVVSIGPVSIAPKCCKVWHPAFDITPSRLIKAIITEKGVIKAPYIKSIDKLMQN